jgi:endonuclease YncB( thermonuclease family)
MVAALALLASGCETGEERTPQGAGDRGTVEWVVDGDTIRLTDGRIVRLVQIDAPEARSDCYGRDATRALIRRTPKGTEVTLRRDPALDGVDGYGRLLRYVFVGRRNVNVDLVEGGAAAPYFFRSERGRYAGELLRWARDARDARRGFWGACPRARLEPGLGSVTGPVRTQRR